MVFPMVHLLGAGRRRPAPENRLNVAARSGICFGSRPIVESAPIMSTMGLAFSWMGPKPPSPRQKSADASRCALTAAAAGACGGTVTQKSLFHEAAHLGQRSAGGEGDRLQSPPQRRGGLLLADGGAFVAYALGRQRKGAAFEQGGERARDHFRRGGAAGQDHIHLHHFAEIGR